MEFSGGPCSYYRVLGVGADACDEEIRRAYRKLAMQWHPDKWTRSPSCIGEANQRFQQIQEAYTVLSDGRKRMLYDAGLYELDDGEDEGFSDFLLEMVSLMNDSKKEDTSIEDLQRMFWDMARGFEMPEWNNNPLQQSTTYASQCYFGSLNANNPGARVSNSWGTTKNPGAPFLNESSYGNNFCNGFDSFIL